jgi:hypothetical protein
LLGFRKRQRPGIIPFRCFEQTLIEPVSYIRVRRCVCMEVDHKTAEINDCEQSVSFGFCAYAGSAYRENVETMASGPRFA